MTAGRIEAIYIASAHGELPHAVDSAVAHPGRGLEGDRNFNDPEKESCDITLIEAEAFDNLEAVHGFELKPLESRRQVLVRGVDLGQLIGKSFSLGVVECAGEERCEPCNHLASMVGTQAVLRGLLHTGLRARVTKGGTIHVQDPVSLLSATSQKSQAAT